MCGTIQLWRGSAKTGALSGRSMRWYWSRACSASSTRKRVYPNLPTWHRTWEEMPGINVGAIFLKPVSHEKTLSSRLVRHETPKERIMNNTWLPCFWVNVTDSRHKDEWSRRKLSLKRQWIRVDSTVRLLKFKSRRLVGRTS